VPKLYPRIKTLFAVGAVPPEKHHGEPDVLDFDAELARQPADRLVSGRVIEPHEICAYFHTGGTTGSPKLAQHTHWGEVYQAWVLARLIGLGTSDTMLLGLPLFHVNAVIVTGLSPFYAGASTVILSPTGYRNPEVIRSFWKIVERYRATVFSGVPTIYASLLNVPLAAADVSSLRFGVCGAAPMPVELFQNFERATGIKILEGYGLTESTCAASFSPGDGERRIGSIGIRFPYQLMKCVKLDNEGKYTGDCKPGEVGVVAISGPNVFPGYKQAKFNKAAFVEPGWLNTGDLGRQDEDGYFWLVGRAKDLIIRGGHNIDPGQIEEVLHRHPAVALAAAIGKPDAYAGEVPVAYVQLKPGVSATGEELCDFAKSRVPERPAAPVEIFVVEKIPLTAVGKIFKPELRYDITVRALGEALKPLEVEGISSRVTAGPHDSHGLLARVEVSAQDTAAAEAKVRRLLGAYPIRTEIVVG
jgi:fatty-acyl-CoA synthase